jgi:periplasmic divalent cation tolerance protein
MLPAMRSLFEWQGRRGEAQETGVILKTDAALLGRAITRLSELHSCAQPVVPGRRIDEAIERARAWPGALAS